MPIYKVRHDAMLMDDDTYWIHRIEEVEAGSVEEEDREEKCAVRTANFRRLPGSGGECLRALFLSLQVQ